MNTYTRLAVFQIVYQFLLRIVTFVINATVLRYTTHAILGIINVRLTLFYQTALFLAREPLRNKAAREGYSANDHKNSISKNLLTILGVLLFWLWTKNENLIELSIISFGVFIELCSEDVYLSLQAQNRLENAVKTETQSHILRTCLFGLLVTLLLNDQSSHVLVFAICLLLGSIFYFFTLRRFQSDSINVSPKAENVQVSLSVLTFQQYLKQALTEAQGYLMTFTTALSPSEQGVFDTVNSLASLPARFLFQPIEKSAFQFCTHCDASDPNFDTKLQLILRCVNAIAIMMACFGTTLAETALRIYSGSDSLAESGGAKVFSLLCIYQIPLALNGISEAIANAKMDAKQMKTHNLIYVISSCAVVGVSWLGLFLGKGGSSFVFANMLAMLIRIGWNMYIWSTLSTSTFLMLLLKTLPKMSFLVVVFGSWFIMTWVVSVGSILLILFSTAVLAGITVMAYIFSEVQVLDFLRVSIKKFLKYE